MKLLKGNRIQPIDNQVSNLPSLIPRPSFVSYVCASRGSGKTIMLINMLTNSDLLAGKFNQVYLINPTAKLDAKYNILKETKGITKINSKLIKKIKEESKDKSVKIFDDYSESNEINYETSIPESNFIEKPDIELLNNIIEEQKAIIKRYGKDYSDKILLVYDDCIGYTKFWKSEAVKKLVYNSRHFNISIIITSQSYFGLPKPLRLNCSSVMVFYTGNQKEVEAIYEENTGGLNKKQFLKMYNEVCGEPFGFLHICYQNDLQHRFIKNLESFVDVNELKKI